VLPLVGLARTSAGRFLPELIAANSLTAVKPVSGYALSPWAGLGIVCAYAAVLLAVGCVLLVHRDA
jgi:ABC-2 type transport system permease protein